MQPYPMIAACKYEANSSTNGRTVHRAYRAATVIAEALSILETALAEELDLAGQFHHGAASEERILAAESIVALAWTDLTAAPELG